MWLINHHWHFDYVRLARDTDFSFENTKSPLDKNKLCMIDLNKIVAERDVGVVEEFMPSIIQYNTETAEHVGIIDQNFLKIFRLSQLAVEYLLFCKKYLDHTVTLMKEEIKSLKLENKEIKTFNDELKQHTDVLLGKLKMKDVVCTFNCTRCSKAFSTAEYLAAHVERRHSNKNDDANFGLDIEMEIKEIKQKLNNTEKMMKNEVSNPKLEDTLNKNYSKVSELLHKFESLKIQLESDFKVLQTQKDFEEKYSKIFHSALENVKNQSNNEFVNTPCRSFEKRNSITQTDIIDVQTYEKTVQVEECPDAVEQKLSPHVEDVRLRNLEEQIRQACESMTNTMGSSLKHLEAQMLALWEKLQDMESKKKPEEITPNKNEVNVEEVEEKQKQPKPKIRKRFGGNLENVLRVSGESEEGKMYEHLQKEPMPSKFSSKTRYDDLDRIDVLDEEVVVPSRSVTVVKSANTMYETEESESEEEDSRLKSEVIEEKERCAISAKDSDLRKRKSVSTLGKRSITSLRKASLTPEVRDKLKEEMERVINERLADLGLSNEWRGIPEQTYLKAMDILNHQAVFMQKSYPGYQSIRRKLLRIVDEEMKSKGVIMKQANLNKKLRKHRTKVVSSLRTFSNHSNFMSLKKPQSAPQIEIKNRKMFETDSSSDEHPVPNVKRLPSNIIKRTPPYSAVIEELKQTQKSDENIIKIDDAPKTVIVESRFDKKENIKEDNEKIDLQTKGVLKTSPATGPVPKKRVLFDLKTEHSVQEKLFVKDIGGGSTTSVASSVLDLSEDDNFSNRNTEIKNDIQDLSDSDFSIFDDSSRKDKEET